MFVVFFFGIFAYFLWKTFSQPSRSDTREIFEFYHGANEILRDDERRWFGFEVQEVLGRGERLLQVMNGAPPLVYFTLGAIYHKIGDHKSAVNHLSYVIENENADEATYVYPSPDLRSYVKILRKIEREPNEAPQTSAAIRALERARRNRGKAMLDASRIELENINLKKRETLSESVETKNEYRESIIDERPDGAEISDGSNNQNARSLFSENNSPRPRRTSTTRRPRSKKPNSSDGPFPDRKPITEVLHDIYDKNVQ